VKSLRGKEKKRKKIKPPKVSKPKAAKSQNTVNPIIGVQTKMSTTNLPKTEAPPAVPEIKDFESGIRYIADRREVFAEAESFKKQAEAKYKLSSEYQYYSEAKAELEEAECALKDFTLAHFAATENNKPHAAVQVKQVITFDVSDETLALAYCVSSLPQALSYNKNVFKRVILTLPEDKRPGCVEIGQKPRVYIARDLSEYTSKPEADHGE